MTPDDWKKIKEILADAAEIEPGPRAAFLDQNCPTELRTRVDELLRSDRTNADLLDRSPAFDLNTDDVSKDRTGERVGPYEIVGILGMGGMGTVYLAKRADGEFEQQVALKLIKRGMDSDAIVGRFVNERQILASLDHPNIAHLIDGGTTPEGLPFIVMEYVEGTPIDIFCDENDLHLDQRLDLFREVCGAVSFAHQKLVIHRDLKPQNILITSRGDAKLLDFGIAKLVKADSSNETRTQTLAFTPEYASPEQIRGEELSTATDIYSLGVVLYELVTGNRPLRFDGKNIAEIINTVTQTDPTPPSNVVNGVSTKGEKERGKSLRLKRALRGDLDNIILKALKKEPTRRYSSVEQFSEDIRRHLRGLPVTARQDSWAYRTEKFARRNPVLVGTVVLALLILVGGIVATAYQARQADIERERAEARFNDVRALANSFMFEINEEITKSPIRARELLVQRAIEYLDKLAVESEGNIELKSELAAAYEKIGEVQSDIFRPFSGKTSEALLSHQKALRLREEIFRAQPSSENGTKLGLSRQNIGNVLVTSGKLSEALENYRAAIGVLESQVELDPANVEVRRHLGRGYSMLGQAIVRSGPLADALENYEKSLQLFKALSLEDPSNDGLKRSVGIVMSYIGFVKMEMGKTDDASADYRTWLEIEKSLVAKDPKNIEFRHDLGGAHIWYGVILSEQAKIGQAREHFLEGIAIQEAIFAADKENVGEDYSLADCYLEFGKAMARSNVADLAIQNLERALTGYRRIWQKDQQNLMTRHRIANTQRFLGDAFVQRKDLARAHEHYEQAHTVFVELTNFDPENIDWQQDLAMSHMRRGEISLRNNDRDSALTSFKNALPIFEKLAMNSPDNIKRRNELDDVRELLAKLTN